MENESSSESLRPRSKKRRSCPGTLTICLPDSILGNAQSFELRTYLVGQIARAAAIYNVDEIVILKDSQSTKDVHKKQDFCAFFIRNLEYIVRPIQETPQYLRKALFPMHPDLKFSGLLNPLDTPHHLRAEEWSKYREGVVVERPTKSECGSWANIGLKQVSTTQDVQIDVKLVPRTRVTVQLTKDDKGKLSGTVVSSDKPRRRKYWGYSTRIAEGVGQVLSECPYDGGYDLTVGTSDKGDFYTSQTVFPEFHHALICFGGLAGLEDIIESDESLATKDPRSLFQYYFNVCPGQGTRTIRTEEAVLITLARLSPDIRLVGS